MNDSEGPLEEQGPKSRLARSIRFTSVQDVNRLTDTVKAYIDVAIGVEEAGLEMGPPRELFLVAELRSHQNQDPKLKVAFEALTLGLQRGYNLYFKGAKQAKTRAARVEKYLKRILDGKGFSDK